MLESLYDLLGYHTVKIGINQYFLSKLIISLKNCQQAQHLLTVPNYHFILFV